MRIFIVSIILSFFSIFCRADEGMWMPWELDSITWNQMLSGGFELSRESIYSESTPSMKDAVVIFGGGCTGITVSEQGLIFTNHHCGFDAIQSQSSVEHDYLKDGFIAKTITDELPIPGLKVKYLLRTEEVTSFLFSATDTIPDEYSRLQEIRKLSRQMEDSIQKMYDSEFIEALIVPYFDQNKYYLNVYEVFPDVRMVLAPPSSVGKFGGDTDNWMWPRHTGDFSIFRVYAGADNKPAEFNETNKTYQPRSYARIAKTGIKESDYCMTIGFPGRTKRYLSSWGINQRINSSNKPRIEVRGIKQDIWKEAMLASDEVRIKYASKFARSANYWKNSIGMNRGLEQMNVIKRKEDLESQFREWVVQTPERKEKYGEALRLMKDGYTGSDENMFIYTYLLESFLEGTEICRMTWNVMGYDINQSEEKRQEYIRNIILPRYKNYDASLDQKVLVAMLKIVRERVPVEYLPPVYKEIDKKFKGDYEKYARFIFEKSVIPYPEKLEKVLQDKKKVAKLDKDPAYHFAKSVGEKFDAAILGINNYQYDVMKGERLFFAGLKELFPEKNFSSDANSTMRLSFGSIKGYKPYDGAWYDYFTTQDGIFEKYKAGDPEFDLQEEIRSLLKEKQFGVYGNEDGNLSLCFLSNNDITGGNSGSPMFNGRGEVIGLAFDGNWEAMSGDIAFEPEVQRTIGVDIRYVLFLIDRWANSERLLEELKFMEK